MMERCDALVIGGGPAGLTAALYLGRFRRSVIVVENDASRARWIPLSHNCPGFPRGVSGRDYLDELREQCRGYDIRIVRDTVGSLRRENDGFVATSKSIDEIHASRVVMATGIADTLAGIEGEQEAICTGLLRLCPVCDAYEIDGQRIAIYGPADAAPHALFLRTFVRDLTFLSLGAPPPAALEELEAAGVTVFSGRGQLAIEARGVRFDPAGAGVSDRSLRFDAVYLALGATPNAELARSLGARCDADGYLEVDRHQATTVAGLYAIGDVARNLHQISVATGEAAIASSAVHQSLEQRRR